MMERLSRILDAIENSWVADLIGAVCLFAGLWLGLLIGCGWGF